MLVLSRTKGQIIKVGDDIEVMVVESKGGTTQIGIKAPKDVLILRGEVEKHKKEGKK